MKKKLHLCQNCGAILLKNSEGVFWQPMDCYEQSALATIITSPTLLVITGTLQICYTLCDLCSMDVINPKVKNN